VRELRRAGRGDAAGGRHLLLPRVRGDHDQRLADRYRSQARGLATGSWVVPNLGAGRPRSTGELRGLGSQRAPLPPGAAFVVSARPKGWRFPGTTPKSPPSGVGPTGRRCRYLWQRGDWNRVSGAAAADTERSPSRQSSPRIGPPVGPFASLAQVRRRTAARPARAWEGLPGIGPPD
jgi:hypothetical protein